jgi:hypothetical protein
MSRWKRLEELEQHLPQVTAQELQNEIPFWRAHANALRGPGHKLAMKLVHKLERALEVKLRQSSD